MPTSYTAGVLFDLDGTLVDTAADFIVIINKMRSIDGMPPIAAEKIRNTVSDGARALITLAYDMVEGDDGFDTKRQWLLDLYDEELGHAANLFPGFEALIKRFEANNIAWGIVTNKPAQFTDKLLQRLNLNPSNKVAICPDHVTQTKPHPEPILLAMEKLGLTAQNCIYVGDHERDIAAGLAANIATIACRYGYIKEDDNIENWQADYIVDDVAALEQQIFALL
ncbi:MAG: HAD-IA family hydrolase [Pseudomonadales bacterium]|nr:HAD-IA family hydrolase [Pseudomonadales bacterium]